MSSSHMHKYRQPGSERGGDGLRRLGVHGPDRLPSEVFYARYSATMQLMGDVVLSQASHSIGEIQQDLVVLQSQNPNHMRDLSMRLASDHDLDFDPQADNTVI